MELSGAQKASRLSSLPNFCAPVFTQRRPGVESGSAHFLRVTADRDGQSVGRVVRGRACLLSDRITAGVAETYEFEIFAMMSRFTAIFVELT